MTDTGVVLGLSAMTFLFSYISFHLRENENLWNQMSSLIMFNLSMAFANMTIFSLLLMVQNDANLSYLEHPIMVLVVEIVMWVTIVMMALFIVITLFNGLKAIYDEVTKKNRSAI